MARRGDASDGLKVVLLVPDFFGWRSSGSLQDSAHRSLLLLPRLLLVSVVAVAVDGGDILVESYRQGCFVTSPAAGVCLLFVHNNR